MGYIEGGELFGRREVGDPGCEEIGLPLSFLVRIGRSAHQKKDKEKENAMVSLVCTGFVCFFNGSK